MNIPDDVVQASALAVREVVNFGDDRGCWCEDCTAAATEVAAAALSAALPLLAFDRDEVARIIGGAVYGDPTDLSRATKAADAVIAASPLRSVIEVKAEALEEFARHLRETYPEDLFPPLTRGDNARIKAALDRAKTRSRDSISADMMRHAAAQAETRAARLREGGQP